MRATAAACCAAGMLATPALAGAAGPGAPGVGDEYFPHAGNGGYDVSHYDIRVRYQPETDHLRGTTTIVAEPTKELTTFNLDFALGVESVRVNGERAEFTRESGSEVTVNPAGTLAEGSLATFVVEYSGTPSKVEVDGENPWIRTDDGALAVGQPQVAEWWFPSSDHPSDKATFDISATVPNGTEVLANGMNTGRSELAGWTTWKWRMTEPSATYLAFMAVGQYEVNGKVGDSFVTAYGDDLGRFEGAAKASIERTPEVVDFLSGLVGEYPFHHQGGVVSDDTDMGFALETQTRPVYSPLFFQRGSNVSVVVHENAHQWFGDSIAVEEWSEIWINEGFATYAEWMWSEAQGTSTAQELFDHYYSAYPADHEIWQVTPGDPGVENLFHASVYDRGAMTLHALRNRIGDQALFDTVRTWVEQQRGGNAAVDEFIALAERTSGQQLDEFFDAWLFSKGKPAAGEVTGVPAQTAARTAAVAPEPKAVAELNRTHELLSQRHQH
ncbi:aminopeptidase N [Saccharopolyspora lacisalsi]|uniref:Aminopeptidase N n=1 Tax=Halosaccharopolyspora lacisalsi TaxID=1000566 RepID=A0A839E048_9PSEU|nr:aminopeptidase N [Halosaccharopolyspora lacisalsi]